jgi:hypothetical protein
MLVLYSEMVCDNINQIYTDIQLFTIFPFFFNKVPKLLNLLQPKDIKTKKVKTYCKSLLSLC